MLVDMHNHTYLCNHADGTVDDYLNAAIKNKIDIYGFSDHAPMNFDEGFRMKFSQMDFYENMILTAKEKFKDKIEVLLAYEVDFLDNYMDERIFSRKVDYLIGSVHFLNNWGFDNPEFIGLWHEKNIDDVYMDYFNQIVKLCKYGKFDILGHFDLIKVFKFLPSKDIRILANDAIKAIKQSDIVVEVNTSGFRKPINEQYPSDILLEQLAQNNIPITLSSDAHSPKCVAMNYDKIIKKVRDFGFNKVAIFRQRDIEFIKL